MSRLQEITEQLQDTEAAIAHLERAIAREYRYKTIADRPDYLGLIA